jgi:hypothetical protein
MAAHAELLVNYPDGSAAQIVSPTEGYGKHEVSTGSGRPAYVSDVNVTNSPADTLVFCHATFSERYQFKDNRGGCWDASSGGRLHNRRGGGRPLATRTLAPREW